MPPPDPSRPLEEGGSDLPRRAPAPAAGSPALERLGSWLQPRAARLAGSPLFWVVSLSISFLSLIGSSLARERPTPPALHLQLPPFSLLDERGEPFSLDTLRGKVWVADFVFTSCPSVCPKLTQRMAELQHRARNMGDGFHLVSFTVDPENDTPEKLQAYARLYHANPHHWSFVTGPLGDLEKTVVKGFKIAMGREKSEDGIFAVFHGERLVLVDRAGVIRGYFEATDEGLTELLRNVSILANVDESRPR